MKLWMLIMLGYGIYRLFATTETMSLIEIKSKPRKPRKQKTQEHTMLVTYSRPRGERVSRPKQLTEVNPKRDRGMFSKNFINNNTQEADYVEVD